MITMQLKLVAWAVVIVMMTALCSAGRSLSSGLSAAGADSLHRAWARHTAGRLGLTVSNFGGMAYTASYPVYDYVTGEAIVNSSEFPIGSGRNHLAAVGLWIGAIVGTDTLVSEAYGDTPLEFGPIAVNGAWFDYRRSIDREKGCQSSLVSDEDFAVAFTDTAVSYDPNSYDFLDRRPHKPLNIEVTEESYSWSYRHAADIVFFHLVLRNIGEETIKDGYVGLLVRPLGGYAITPTEDSVGYGNVVGYLKDAPIGSPCPFRDTVNVAWVANRDGSPQNGTWSDSSAREIFGVRFLESANRPRNYSFNWWSWVFYEYWDYGPMRRDNCRDYRTGPGYTGFPAGDRNAYFALSNGEIDFPSPFTAALDASSGWLLPEPILAQRLSSHGFPWFEVSTGPYDIPPGAIATVDFCILAADTFHVDPQNGANLPYNPQAWYAHVDFSGLAKNATWAQRIYDNPGVDTDGDGYAGEYRVCVLDSALVDGNWVATKADTEWYKGDGVPDWRAATPPIAPQVWVESFKNGLHVRFNGEVSETAEDVLTHKTDFEGYRVYLGRDERRESFSLIASYDKEDYDKWVFDSQTGEWDVWEDPFSLEQLRCLYGNGSSPCEDSSFLPRAYYDRSHLFQLAGFPDSVFYFTPHDYNNSKFGELTRITKTYPDEPDPRSLRPEEITPEMYTEDGYLKFYEYELDINNLLATVSYCVSVTAFDFGSPTDGVAPLESDLTEEPVEAFPMHELDAPLSGSEKVYVYPNPYRIDANYRDLGFEGRGQDDKWDERVRSIWFANLPPKCTINIWTLDGDRVRTIEHDVPISDPTYSRERWDLINRNFQIIVSGLYYWTVEAPDKETQIGKLVILR